MAGTNLAHSIEVAKDASAYDTNVKYLLADKQILAYILKYAMVEFQDLPIDQIVNCIGDDVEIGARPVDAGMSNLGRIQGSDTEDNIPGEGKIFYDIRFSAYLKGMEVKLLLNLEAQKSTDSGKLGYHLENRIIFYLSRMVSAQKHTEFFHSDYDSLKKVRSIWICMDGDETGEAIEEISLETKRILGDKSVFASTGFMKGIVIHIKNKTGRSSSKNKLISMLENLFSEINISEKKRILTEEYGMVMTTELEGEIDKMCNFSEAIIERSLKRGLERGIEQGLQCGIEQGLQRGLQQERFNAIERMIKANATKEQILSYGYTEEEYAKVENGLCEYV